MSYHRSVASYPIGVGQTTTNGAATAMAGIVITGAMLTLGFLALRPPKRRRAR